MKNLLKIAALTALIPATALLANDKPKGNPFKNLDKDSDGKISKEEFLAGPQAQKNPEQAAKRFEKADADKDGFLTPDEFKASMPKPGEGKKKKDAE